MGDNYVSNSLIGKQCHERRKKLEFSLQEKGLTPLKEKIYENLAKMRVRVSLLYGTSQDALAYNTFLSNLGFTALISQCHQLAKLCRSGTMQAKGS